MVVGRQQWEEFASPERKKKSHILMTNHRCLSDVARICSLAFSHSSIAFSLSCELNIPCIDGTFSVFSRLETVTTSMRSSNALAERVFDEGVLTLLESSRASTQELLPV
jgi:hypothetical protein